MSEADKVTIKTLLETFDELEKDLIKAKKERDSYYHTLMAIGKK
jgi:hypothetical protein